MGERWTEQHEIDAVAALRERLQGLKEQNRALVAEERRLLERLAHPSALCKSRTCEKKVPTSRSAP